MWFAIVVFSRVVAKGFKIGERISLPSKASEKLVLKSEEVKFMGDSGEYCPQLSTKSV